MLKPRLKLKFKRLIDYGVTVAFQDEIGVSFLVLKNLCDIVQQLSGVSHIVNKYLYVDVLDLVYYPLWIKSTHTSRRGKHQNNKDEDHDVLYVVGEQSWYLRTMVLNAYSGYGSLHTPIPSDYILLTLTASGIILFKKLYKIIHFWGSGASNFF